MLTVIRRHRWVAGTRYILVLKCIFLEPIKLLTPSLFSCCCCGRRRASSASCTSIHRDLDLKYLVVLANAEYKDEQLEWHGLHSRGMNPNHDGSHCDPPIANSYGCVWI